jgi:hypothetical protein
VAAVVVAVVEVVVTVVVVKALVVVGTTSVITAMVSGASVVPDEVGISPALESPVWKLEQPVITVDRRATAADNAILRLFILS